MTKEGDCQLQTVLLHWFHNSSGGLGGKGNGTAKGGTYKVKRPKNPDRGIQGVLLLPDRTALQRKRRKVSQMRKSSGGWHSRYRFPQWNFIQSRCTIGHQSDHLIMKQSPCASTLEYYKSMPCLCINVLGKVGENSVPLLYNNIHPSLQWIMSLEEKWLTPSPQAQRRWKSHPTWKPYQRTSSSWGR